MPIFITDFRRLETIDLSCIRFINTLKVIPYNNPKPHNRIKSNHNKCQGLNYQESLLNFNTQIDGVTIKSTILKSSFDSLRQPNQSYMLVPYILYLPSLANPYIVSFSASQHLFSNQLTKTHIQGKHDYCCHNPLL